MTAAAAAAGTTLRISADDAAIGYHYDASRPPVLTVDPGATVEFETLDARAGALYDRPVGVVFELPRPSGGRSNPLTGPLAIRGAEPGDALAIDIEAVDVAPHGWAGGHAYVNPLWPGRVPRALAKIVPIRDGVVEYSERIRFPSRPMLGCIGVAAPVMPGGGAIHAGFPGRHGGNMDQKVVTAGTTLYLPVLVPGAMLYIGDAHAAQGDGELSGTAIEIGSLTRVRVRLIKGGAPAWPWLETADRWMVLTADHHFEVARREAVDAVMTVLERDLGMEPAEALALLAGAADLRIGQSMGGTIPMTLRLEIPKWEGVNPLGPLAAASGGR